MSNYYDTCIYPDCSSKISPNKSVNGLCKKHASLLKFFIWTLDNIRVKNEEDMKED